jgi:hypothetical protein
MSARRRIATSMALALVLLPPPASTTAALLPAARAADATAPVPASASAAWLAALLTDGERMVSRDFDIDDVDLTLDVVLGLVAARSAGIEQQRILAWFSAGVEEHVGSAADATYVAVTAKAALAVMSTGGDPRVVGEVDLIALLLGQVGADGRVSDRGALGDLSSTASQSLAVLALDRAGADAATTGRAASFLARTACLDGGFSVELAGDVCAAGIVPTALALQALAATSSHDDVLARGTATLLALLDTATWDSGIPEGWQLGLAAQALRATGEDTAAQRLTATLIDRLDGCERQGSGALLDEQDPVRATVGVLLAASASTMSTLDGGAPAPVASLLDCSAAESPAAADLGEQGTDDTAATAADGGPGLAPVAIGLVLLVLVAAVGLPVLRRLRAEHETV